MIRQKLQEALLTSQAKRMKVEVRERLLTDEEKLELREAKKGEWMSFVENNVVELALRSGVDPSRIIGSRWVLTWKAVDGKGTNSKIQKARRDLCYWDTKIQILGSTPKPTNANKDWKVPSVCADGSVHVASVLT